MARGGYTFEQVREMSYTELLFLHHYQEMVKNEQQEFIVNALGVVWDKESLVSKLNVGTENKPIEKLFIPLSVAVNPDILDYVRKQFNVNSKKPSGPVFIGGGEYMPRPGEEVRSMGDLSKDEFMRLIGRRSKK